MIFFTGGMETYWLYVLIISLSLFNFICFVYMLVLVGKICIRIEELETRLHIVQHTRHREPLLGNP